MSREAAETSISSANDDSSSPTSISKSNSYSGSGPSDNEDMDQEVGYFPSVGFDTVKKLSRCLVKQFLPGIGFFCRTLGQRRDSHVK